MFGAADVLRQSEQAGGNPQAAAVRGPKAKIHPAGWRLVQSLDAARSLQRKRARGGKVELFDFERAALEPKARVELARGNIGQQKFADAQGHAHIVAAQLLQEILPGRGSIDSPCRGRIVSAGYPIVGADGGTFSPRAPEPGLPHRPFADHLAQIKTVAVEINLDQAALSALQAQAAAEPRPAQLARRIGKLELAVADDRIGREAEVAGRGLSRYGAIAGGPARQRLQSGALDFDGAGEQRSEVPTLETARGLDAVAPREGRFEALDGNRTVFGGNRHVDGADQIAAEPGLLDGQGERAVAKPCRLGQDLLGEEVKNR